MASLERVVAILAAYFIGTVIAGEYCVSSSYFSIVYCTYGCCNGVCCGFPPWLIVIIVIGVIIAISIVIAAYCCCVKHNGYPGRVISPAPSLHTTNVACVQSAQGEHTMMTWQAGGMPGAYYGYGFGPYGIPQSVQPLAVHPVGPPPYTDTVYPTAGAVPPNPPEGAASRC